MDASLLLNKNRHQTPIRFFKAPITGRYHQLRQHCAEFLGAPIVNDERPLFDAAAPAWHQRTGTPLPPYHVRGGGQLFLQAVAITFPAPDHDAAVQVQIPVSDRFERLLQTSSRAYAEGWRSSADGRTYRLKAVASGYSEGVVEAEATIDRSISPLVEETKKDMQAETCR